MNAARLAITIAAAGLCSTPALAQRRAPTPVTAPNPGGVQAAGVRAGFPTRMPGIGGVRSGFSQNRMSLPQPSPSLGGPRMGLNQNRMSLPQASPTIGGTKAALPRQSSTPNGTFGNPKPDWRSAYKPMSVGPMPSSPANGGNGGGNGNGGWNGNGGGNWHGNGGHGHGGQGGGDNGHWHGQSAWNGSGFVDGSGVTINGAYSDDNFKLAFHVGSPFSHHHDWCNNFNGYPVSYYPPIYYGFPGYGAWNYYPTSYAYDGAYSSYSSSNYAPPMNAAPTLPPTYQATPQPVAPSTEKELADTYLRAGDAGAAIKSYRSHLAAHPKDGGAMRGLALALIESSEFRDGAAMMSLAYATDHALTIVPVSIDAYAGGAAELRDNLSRVSLYANRVKTPSAWLTLAVLMQAEGRSAPAKAAIDKAQAAGLDHATAERFRSAL